MATKRTSRGTAEDTKARILDATEKLFIEVGYEATSVRQVTSRAIVNLAAVNYHFRSKEVMVHTVLSRRLDPLNARRLALLDECEARWPGDEITCEHVFGALFAPALQMAREPTVGGPAFLRLLGRVYSDTSPFISSYLFEHYAPVFSRFFNVFARALPTVPRDELGMRLHLTLKAVACVLASDELSNLMQAFTQGKPMNDAQVLAQLTARVVAALTSDPPSQEQVQALRSVVEISQAQQAKALRQRVMDQAAQTSDEPTSRPRASASKDGSTSTQSTPAADAAKLPASFHADNPLHGWLRMRP